MSPTMAAQGSSSTHLSRGLIRMVRQLHLAPPALPGRQRALLQNMCQLFEARQGSILVTMIDPETGLRKVVDSISLEAPLNGDGDAADPSAARANGRKSAAPAKARTAAEGPAANDGPCHEAFVTLRGVRVARLSLSRDAGRRKFTPAERGLIDAIHAECAWVYEDTEQRPASRR